MNNNVIIKEVAVYHPEKQVHNKFYSDHFQKQGLKLEEIEKSLSALGREYRYVADYEKETTLTMAVEATRRLLKKANLKGEDIDMIVFVSATPEYLFPPNSIYIHREIEGKSECTVFDMNVACVGMTVAMEQASRNMKFNPTIKRTVIVGAEQMHRFTRKDDHKTYASFGDASCAILLERVEEAEERGLIDSIYLTRTVTADKIQFPAAGLAKVLDSDIKDYDKQIKWDNVPEESGYNMALKGVKIMLNRQNLTPDDLSFYFLSQMSRKGIDNVIEDLNQSPEKFIFIGDEFGYTGNSSPFIALERVKKKGLIQKGDYIFIWSLGAGATTCGMIYKA